MWHTGFDGSSEGGTLEGLFLTQCHTGNSGISTTPAGISLQADQPPRGSGPQAKVTPGRKFSKDLSQESAVVVSRFPRSRPQTN